MTPIFDNGRIRKLVERSHLNYFSLICVKNYRFVSIFILFLLEKRDLFSDRDLHSINLCKVSTFNIFLSLVNLKMP